MTHTSHAGEDTTLIDTAEGDGYGHGPEDVAEHSWQHGAVDTVSSGMAQHEIWALNNEATHDT